MGDFGGKFLQQFLYGGTDWVLRAAATHTDGGVQGLRRCRLHAQLLPHRHLPSPRCALQSSTVANSVKY